MALKVPIFLFALGVICNALPMDKRAKNRQVSKSNFDYVKSYCLQRPKINFCSHENIRYMFWKQPNEFNKLVSALELKSEHWSDSDETFQAVNVSSSSQSKSAEEIRNGKKLVKNIIHEFIKLFNS